MSEIPEHIMTDSGEFHEFTTGELVRWLQAKYRRHGEVEDGIAAERLKSLSAEYSNLRRAARTPFFSLHMDGRNEHGTHLLSLPGSSIDVYDEVMDQFKDPRDGFSESVFQEAEKLGFRTGHAIVTTWYWDGDGIEMSHYLEYVGVSEELTRLFWGDPDEQNKMFATVSGTESPK